MKCSCGRLSYRPDPVTTRRFAERCSGCHRITGRCSCAAIWLGGNPGPEYVPAEEPEALPRTAAGRRLLENLDPRTPGQFEADRDAILAIEAEAAMQSSRRSWLAVSRAALRAVPAEAEEAPDDGRLIDAHPKLGDLIETIELELGLHSPVAIDECDCDNQIDGETWANHIATAIDYRLTATDGDA